MLCFHCQFFRFCFIFRGGGGGGVVNIKPLMGIPRLPVH